VRHSTAVTIACGLAAAALLLSGCERNAAESFLVPTGVRPRPEVGTGSIVGRILYDPSQSPDVDHAPFPLTVVELFESGVLIESHALDRDTDVFEFDSLPPGQYTVVAAPRLYFRSSLPPVRVVDGVVDVGDLVAPIDFSQVAVSIHLFGSFDEKAFFADTCALQQSRLGVWFGPNIDPFFGEEGEVLPDTAITLAAGEHRLRFVTNFDTERYYGADEGAAVDAPVSDAPLRVGGSDFVVRIPETGRYRFFLDERRLTVTIEQLPPTGAVAKRSPIP